MRVKSIKKKTYKNVRPVLKRKWGSKTSKRRTLKKGGTVLGYGSEGCIIDSFTCNNNHFLNTNLVAKVLKDSLNNSNYELIHKILLENDPDEERYALYHLKNFNECNFAVNDLKTCERNINSTLNSKHFYLTKKLEPIPDIKKLTVRQYRFLRDSVENLRKIGIYHGDLLDNVMLSSITNLPVIIDWGHNSGILKKDDPDILRNFDYSVFLDNYKSVKK